MVFTFVENDGKGMTAPQALKSLSSDLVLSNLALEAPRADQVFTRRKKRKEKEKKKKKSHKPK